ncbi:MAG: hypothetical protein K2X27_21635 [Candidatus Obscuribacterales bacterium]|nr:hypothetical protein [Candidatus Obscuribacterales bacterium]
MKKNSAKASKKARNSKAMFGIQEYKSSQAMKKVASSAKPPFFCVCMSVTGKS